MKLACAIALAIIAAFASPSYAAGDAAHGDTLYHATYSCNECHGNPTATADIVQSGQTSAGLLAAIQSSAEMRARYGHTLATLQADLDDIAAYLASFLAAPTADVIEYYHAVFDHYFITDIVDEITKLDNGTFVGWVRTGYKFKAYPASHAGASTVCRFFSTSFAPKSSHFYTPFANECATLQTNPNWQYEGDVMYIAVAAADGTCPAGTVAVYRLYNNGQGGAPNHRFVVDPAQRDLMLGRGYVLEGNGPGFASMCAPT